MYRSVWKNYHKSVCSIEFYSKNGIRFYRATGFRYKDHIISDLCREELVRAERVLLSFFCDGINGPACVIDLKAGELSKRITGEIRNDYSGVKFIRLTQREMIAVPSLASGIPPHPATGTPVAIIGFSRSIDRPYLKTGIVSSRVMIGGDKFVHIETSLEPGNAGSPVIDGTTGSLVAVITDCVSSQLRDYKMISEIIELNIRTLSQSNGSYVKGGIDMSQAIRANLHIIRHLSRNIHLSSHRNHGFAVPFARIARYAETIEQGSQASIKEDEQLLK